MNESQFAARYLLFDSPVTAGNCGERCAPYNEHGVPFCCDIHHAVPSVYPGEWAFLNGNTDQWRKWEGGTPAESERIRAQLPENQIAVVCQGHTLCRRAFRSIACRSFPFFPYLTREGHFIGMSYYWEYEDRCWVISNLAAVTSTFREEFTAAYEQLFARLPDERETYRQFSARMRRSFAQRKRAIPLLHCNGFAYKITPGNGRLRRIDPARLPAFGPYQIARLLPFPDEL